MKSWNSSSNSSGKLGKGNREWETEAMNRKQMLR